MTQQADLPTRPHLGMSLRERVRARDSFGVLLVLILAALFASSISFPPFGGVLRALTTGAALLFALWTSAASRKEIVAAGVVVVIAAVLSVPFEYGSRTDRVVSSAASVLLTVGVLGAVVRRVRGHSVISGATVAAALCVYLLLGLTFAGVYGLIGALDPAPAFKGTERVGGDGSPLDHTYFSFTTLTTVGYGDLAANTDPMRIMAVTEAATGQLYLVTVVALLVANLGRERRRNVRVGDVVARDTGSDVVGADDARADDVRDAGADG
jgi:hypothetical protein